MIDKQTPEVLQIANKGGTKGNVITFTLYLHLI
jgi:hypothetical protein